jgi:phage tail protein X
MTDYVTYVTKDGDRWDSIAYAYYGDAFGYEPIIAANPSVPIRPTLTGGIKLLIPIRDAATTSASAPPWKRST